MNDELKNVSSHMLELGLAALQHANWHSNYFSMENHMWHELSVLQAAHAMEILIKARIAQEHPLLIFEQLPKQSKDSESLDFKSLFMRSKTIQYSELPDRLWAVTGITIINRDLYDSFGKLRNFIQHFSAPIDRNCSEETILYIYKVIDPFINECWGLSAINYNEDTEPYLYLLENLISREIEFSVPKEALKYELNSIDFSNCSDSYKQIMYSKFNEAGYTLK
ncbi:hypothetical protein [Mannheimia varigena]|uniref:hypothetical protein n=1 Tax=Mannheimia varigena TaxID=85404 RepID=UPI0003E32D46|nr:hypothetical protein [Mannheimia varigena]AHG76903.1 hypothetical protein X874_2650 [Mannheimia varigena USDA-ARS-USMARC-1312]